ncbi:3-hydroxybutyrate dehydrogenase [Nitritalea halalkaliphila LW7]|uniref:3-hydroxybutyrate dehydrogenase n=1 Tax=Nitritalea halalkaliphila LW7 TaxID=1189621 RepID=I5C8C3_9BACT|nr:3-hydroxybutyrate dehydrogenase [Nitritalea halalkaliphila]EIM78075.1 3-hydroxybutyrate dehydrogenase [Nitritalea halalkaliphila LW7]
MKHAIITGSTSGIGLGLARQFAQAGYGLMLHGLDPEGPALAQSLAQEYAVPVHFSDANLMHPEAISTLIDEAHQAFGSIEVLINNAGIQHVAPVEAFPAAKWEAILSINLSAAFYASQAVWPHMKQAAFGRIINISSAHGLRASAFKSAYVTAKHGITGLTKALALEGAPHGITVNAICPGYVKTPLVEGQIRDQALSHKISEAEVVEKIMLVKQPIKSFIPVADIAALALFLASDAGKTMTGASLPIEGGWTAQ